MRITKPPSEAEAARAADPTPLPAGQHPATIVEASDSESKNHNETIRLRVVVVDSKGSEHHLLDGLSATPRGVLRLRHAAAAVGALDDFESGYISAQQFVGREVVITTAIEKKPGYPRRAVIVDYAAAATSSVVTLRQAR